MKALVPVHHVMYGCANVQVYHANVGEGIARHEHTYAHLTLCHAGRLRITKERSSLVMTKDTQPVNLIANEWHELEALEDGTVFVNLFTSENPA